MFCPNCGTQLPDNADFCPNCGNRIKKPGIKLPGGISGSNTAIFQNKKIIAGAAAVVVIILAVIVLKSCSSDRAGATSDSRSGGMKSCEQVLDKYGKTIIDKDVEGYIGCFPSEMRSGLEGEYKYYREANGMANNQFNFLQMVQEVKPYTDYKIKSVNEMSENDLESLKEFYGLDISEACSGEVELIQEYNSFGGGTAQDIWTSHVTVGKIGKGWYLLSGFDKYIR